MQKGKFGFRTWLYPFLALWGVLTGPVWLPFAVLGFVLILDNDPWTGRQCVRVVLFNFYWMLYLMLKNMVLGFPLAAIPVAGAVYTGFINFIHFIVTVVLIVFVFVKGTGKLKRGEELTIPGGKISDLVYDRVQAAPVYAPQPQQGYQPPPSYQQAPPQYQQPQYQQAPPPQTPPPPQQATGEFVPPPPPPPTPGGQQ